MSKYTLNPDGELVKEIISALKANDGFCPCKLDRTPENKCPCEEFRTEGHCHCKLYMDWDPKKA